MSTEGNTDFRELLRRSLLKISELKAELSEHERARSEPIAIVGMGCRFPGGGDHPDAFFRALRRGVDAVREIPPARWPAGAIPAGHPGTRWAALVDAVDGFDASFFGIAPREAAAVDPQQRLLLEVSWEALEDAGLPPDRLAGTRTGVFIGMAATDYQQQVVILNPAADAYCTTGSMLSMAAGRLSYVLGLEGPCLVIDTACSSSLVALHLACQSLRDGESQIALAGGVNVILSPITMNALAQTQALSPDGRCKTFDAAANGFVRGEGCGVVVLKRLSDAQRDGDRIWAVVRGSAVNQDGRSTGLTAPNVRAQQALLRQALQSAHVAPSHVGYVEAHGTGTSLGDPIEVEALREVLGAPRADGSACFLGSVKTNLGHLEGAAGIAGVIKTALSMHHGVIPRHLHFQELNPRISLDDTSLVIPVEETPWPRRDTARIAGVSSFGMSGTNAHVVLEEAPAQPARGAAAPSEESAPRLLPLSARSPEALTALAEAYQRHLTNDAPEGAQDVTDIAATASARRSHHDHRLAVVGRSRGEWAESLHAFLRGEAPASVARGHAAPGMRPKVAFVFPGHGAQWLGMGRELWAHEAAFRHAIEACDEAIRREAGFSLIDEIMADEGRPGLDRIEVVQPALFAMGVALFSLWRSWGVEPDVVVGHSMGEIAAAYAADALSLHDAVRVVCRRSTLLKRVSGKGAMALIELPLAEAEARLRGDEDRVWVALQNSPRSTVISGDPRAIDALLVRLEREQVFCKRVNTDVAFHCPHMDPLRDELAAALSELAPRPASIKMLSTVTGEVVHGTELDAAYWARNLRAPVLFAQAIETLVAGGHTLFLELSPHPILVPAIEEALPRNEGRGAALGSLRRGQPERRALLESLGALFARGYPVSWTGLYPAGGRCVSLPTYPWQRERHWVEDERRGQPKAGRASARAAAAGHPLLGAPFSVSTQPEGRFWEGEISLSSLPLLSDHRVLGDAVLPAAAYVEMALAAANEGFGEGTHALEDVTFERMLWLTAETTRTVQLVLAGDGADRATFSISSREGDAWVQHASGRVRRTGSAAAPPPTAPPRALMQRFADTLAGAELYRRMEERGLSYGARFQGVEKLWVGADEVLGRVRLPDELASQDAFQVHPVLLDACFQALAGVLSAPGAAEGTVVPVAVEHIEVYRRPGREVWVIGRRHAGDAGDAPALAADLTLVDDDGEVVSEVRGLRAQRLAAGHAGPKDPEEEWLYALEWSRKEPLPEAPPAASTPGAWLVFMDRGGTGAALAKLLRERGETCIQVVAGDRYARLEPHLYRLDPTERGAYRALLRDAFDKGLSCRGIIHLSSLDAAAPAELSAETLDIDLGRGSLSALYLAQALVHQGFRDSPPLLLVTRGAQALGPEQGAVAVSQAPLWGLGRVLSLEHPELRCTRVDVDPSPTPEDAAALLRELGASDGEDQIAWRGGGRFVARLARFRSGVEASPEEGGPLEPAGGCAFRLETREPGVLARLRFAALERRAPGAGEVEIEVVAAGLNFIDVMKAMGVYPGLPPGPIELGGECAGRISAVGEGVRHLQVGDEVIAIASGSFGSHVTTRALFAVQKPSQLGFEQAAAIPLVFMTVVYALGYVGRLRRGERVLIHAASGGTGLAAIQYAQSVGAEIFATAGSDEKRAYLRSLGVEHVMDSRSLAFADEVMERTGGRGVDVVLNSLSGEAIQKSLEVLAPYGRFLEIGKRDIYDNRRLGLLPFRKSLQYAAVDLAGMAVERPELFIALLQEVVGHVEAGMFKPLPTEVFPASEVEGAFRRMAQAKHIGKLVVSMRDPEVRIAAAASSRPSRLRADGSYLVAGGLGGLGLSVAQWMVAQGARHLALLGRSGASSEAARAGVAALQRAGAEVLVLEADVSRDADVRAALAAVEARLPPLRGVIHAAGVLDDGMMLELDGVRFARATAPKVQGAWNLHASTLATPLDFFVLYSSAASLFGSPGQGNYAAGNAFLDALAHHRRALGLPALSVNWGAFSEVGLAAAQENRGARLADRGVASLSPAEGTRVLDRLLARARGAAQIGVVKLNLRQWLEFYPSAAASPLWSDLLKAGARERPASQEASQLRAALAREKPADRAGVLERHLSEHLGRVLRLDPAKIDRHAAFSSMGLDSLMSLELRNRIESSLGLTLSAALLINHPNLAALATYLVEKLGLAGGGEEKGPTKGQADEALANIVAEVARVSEEQAEEMLLESLASFRSRGAQ